MGSQSKLLEGLHTTVDILILDYTLPYKPLASFLSLSLSLSLSVGRHGRRRKGYKENSTSTYALKAQMEEVLFKYMRSV